uniref:glutathione transferase n=1 Tax=Aegilops tauschii subsp. strangulata TaxID=200361 RepID=A0A453SYF2_AEGTS
MAAMKPVLYSAAISSCSYRVRIALSLKGVEYEYRAVEWNDTDYEKINPIKYVPALQDGDILVSDSLAIILYLEDKYPQHLLLPQDLKRKALNLQIASIVCSSIQPLQCYAVIVSSLTLSCCLAKRCSTILAQYSKHNLILSYSYLGVD